MKPYPLLFLILIAIAAPVSGQTTQPAPEAAPVEWEGTVQALSKSFSTGGADCKAMIAADCTVRAFDASSRELPALFAHTHGATVLMAKAYVFPGGSIATDIATAIADSQVSEDVKKALTPAEGDPSVRANVTATRWAQSSLLLTSSDRFAVMVFANPDSGDTAQTDGQVFFVLLKARRDNTDGYRISHIVYGDSQQATMTSAR